MLNKKIHNFLNREELQQTYEEITTKAYWLYCNRKSLDNKNTGSILRYRPVVQEQCIIGKESDRSTWITNQPNWKSKLDIVWVNIIEKILKEYGSDFEICDCIVNGQTKGMNHWIHCDMKDDDVDETLISIIIYLNVEWKEEWGGHIQYYDQDLNIINRVLPEPGMLIDHDGKCLHQAQGPDVDNLLRLSFACHGAYKK